MITDYTAMLSMGRAQVLLHDGTNIERDIVYNKKCAVFIQGKRSDFSFQRILWDGESWVAGSNNTPNEGELHRLLINRFLEVFPSSDCQSRVRSLLFFASSAFGGYSYGGLVANHIETRLGRIRSTYRRLGFKDQVGRYNAPHYTLREHRFTQRQRDYRRLKTKRNAQLESIVQSLVISYSGNCADFKQGSSTTPSDYSKGWTLRFSDMKIVAYGENRAIKREVDLLPFNLMSPSFVALYGIRNVFCANIVEETSDTICLQVFSKNSKHKGYVCAEKNGEKHTFKQEDPDRWVHLHKYGLDDIGATKAEAYARMLAKS
jgi:hypothetical protein